MYSKHFDCYFWISGSFSSVHWCGCWWHLFGKLSHQTTLSTATVCGTTHNESYKNFCSMPNMFAMCACAHREPSLEFIVITVIVAFFLLGVRVCLSLNVCVRIVCCVSFAHSSHSNSHSHSHLLWLVVCEYLFAWLCVLCMRACICYYFDMSMRLGRFTSTLRIYLCVLIFFSLHQITELLLVPLLLLLLYKWCAIICFFRSLSLSLACLLAHSLIHSLRSSSFSVSLPIIL